MQIIFYFMMGATFWDIRLRRHVHDGEEEELLTLLSRVYVMHGIGEEGDEMMRWNLSKSRFFPGEVLLYQDLCGSGNSVLP